MNRLKELELPEVVHYSLKLCLFSKKERLESEVQMKIVNTTQQTFTEIPFVLYPLLGVQAITDEQGVSLVA